MSQIYVSAPTTLPSISSFWDSTAGRPRDLGIDGTATGLAAPKIYHYGDASTFVTNKGANFGAYTLTANGNAQTGGPGPSFSV